MCNAFFSKKKKTSHAISWLPHASFILESNVFNFLAYILAHSLLVDQVVVCEDRYQQDTILLLLFKDYKDATKC